ncbi:MAG: endolytic transglycosylase MltG [Actinomycetota bacterium]
MFEDWQDDSARGRHRRGRRRGLKLLIAFLLLVLVVGTSAFTYYRWCQGGSGPQRAVTLTIPRGASGGDVVSLLHDKGVVRCGLVSRFELKRRGGTIEAGTYHLTTNMTLDQAFDRIQAGPSEPPSTRFTIPEGWRLTQIAARAQEVLGVSSKDFLAAAHSGDYALEPYLPAGTGSLEGFLFPNTYRFPVRGVTSGDVIRKLLDEFGSEARVLPWAKSRSLGVSDYQVVVVASMIEREARVEGDRSKIAAVIYNRLKIGMPLGIDATIQYIDPDPSDGLTDSDLHIDSPYNTRLHTGLPPTPIASPGLASLRAALQPAQVDYLYYVLCGADGHHEFTSSYDQFLVLKAQCLG